MKISVVIPSYNRGNMVAATLDAILKQTRLPDEVIVVDDGSTDNTAEFIRTRYADRVRLILQENGGPESARSCGIEQASGDWVAICDSDDVWRKDHLARLVAMHEKYPDTTCLFTNFTEVGVTARHTDKFESMGAAFWHGAKQDSDGFMYLGPNQFLRLLPGNPAFTSAMMFSKKFYLSIGGINKGYARLPAGDADLTRRMALQGVMACDWHISVEIAKHGENFSADALKIGLGKITMLRDYLQNPDLFSEYQAEIKNAIALMAIKLMFGAFSYRNAAGFKRVASELPLLQRPFGLWWRSFFMVMPKWLRDSIFNFYDRSANKVES